MRARRRRIYADSSALVKLLVEEPETADLRRYLAGGAFELATSAIARVEVHRAVTIADPLLDAPARVDKLLRGCVVVAVEPVLGRAAFLTSQRVRTLEAIHLASAESVEPHVVLVYDERLARAAAERGFSVDQPGRHGGGDTHADS